MPDDGGTVVLDPGVTFVHGRGMEQARARFEAWITFTGLSDAEIAKRLGCDPSYPRKILRHDRRPGLDLAHAIERLSAAPRADGEVWPEGPIRTEEWVSPHETTVASAAPAGEG